ncbi:phosphotriesterase family protein [Spirillospora sp. CA-294931]|uniref:phosphotriesterase family protein n=1 Tax=Spirillospora sp. CA-294931 TaxID=3240042 RepID=UPI003D8D4C4D
MTPREEPGRLRTVTGTVEASAITGTVLSHEHLQLDLRWPARPALVGSDARRWVDEEKPVTGDLAALRTGHDLGLVIDLTCTGMGRNAAALARISAGSKVAVVAGTGYFTEPFHPDHIRGADEDSLTERLLAEIGFGLDGTSALPGVIGEIGTWGEIPTEAEERCLRAAARAAVHSGLSVATYGRPGLSLLEILTGAGLAASRVAVGQQDLVDDPAAHRKIAESGAYVSFGTLVLAGDGAEALDRRVRSVLELIEGGHAGRVLLSSGVSRMTQVSRYGGHGHAHLFDVFVPALRAAGADKAVLRRILRDNPLNWLTGA